MSTPFLSSMVLLLFSCVALWLVLRRRTASGRLTSDQIGAILDALRDAVVVVDSQSNIVHINQAATQLLGLQQQPMSKDETAHTFEVASADGSILPLEMWPVQLALRGSFLAGIEYRIRRKNAESAVVVEITTAALRNHSGRVTHVVITHHDVTHSKQADLMRIRLAAIVESSEDAIIGKDEKGIVTSWNAAAEKIFGYTEEEMIGTSIRQLIPDDRLTEEDEILGRIKRGKTVEHIETVRRTKSGKIIHVSLTVSPIRDDSGRVVGASKIVRNISERKQLEHQLHQSQKMEAIGQLTGGIAHDFNNLLGIVIGNLDLLERLETENAGVLKRVRTAQKAALRGADLTRRLLAFSSSEDLNPATINLNHSVRNVMELASRVLGPEIKIVPHFDDNLPSVFVDLSGLESALLNLMVNARDAMPQGGKLTISSELKSLDETYIPAKMGELKPGSYVAVSVSDTGTGMPREVMDRVFEPFFTTKPRGRGTGLGLAMVYGFCKQSGGTARIYSEPGLGTTVTLYLPLAANRPVAAQPLQQTTRTGRVCNVLVVDDEEDLLEIALSYLEDLGCKAILAVDGYAAVEILETRQDIDLLITDIVMTAGMDGVDVAKKARQLCPGIRIIYSSGFPADALVERNMTHLDGPLLHKPYQRSEFNAIVVKTLADGDKPGL
ncbi:MAG TPA: PAS domain S-box protein [Acidobacteriaceae bacterium]